VGRHFDEPTIIARPTTCEQSGDMENNVKERLPQR